MGKLGADRIMVALLATLAAAALANPQVTPQMSNAPFTAEEEFSNYERTLIHKENETLADEGKLRQYVYYSNARNATEPKSNLNDTESLFGETRREIIAINSSNARNSINSKYKANETDIVDDGKLRHDLHSLKSDIESVFRFNETEIVDDDDGKVPHDTHFIKSNVADSLKSDVQLRLRVNDTEDLDVGEVRQVKSSTTTTTKKPLSLSVADDEMEVERDDRDQQRITHW
ncbi:uncharacterized protein LOC123507894 [Portunus trituberculatus]|uniref:uncharacterized protein LOC123507894 n=1 Tax=Portunus trituberculatus TaxID=210409 RepID=UPI001E1CD4A6|nr:uncharacterized protein LOC123507894 [Portunus trituberculatus]